MFERLGRFVVYERWWVIVAWLAAAAASVAFAPSLETTSDQANFLPGSYESIRATEIAQGAFGESDGATATIVVKRSDGGELTAADQDTVSRLAEAVTNAGIAKVTGAVTAPQAVSPNRLVQLVTVGLGDNPQDPTLTAAIKDIRTASDPVLANTGLERLVTGDIAMYADNEDAFNDALVIVGAATLILIVLLLLIIYRSPLAAILPLIIVGIVTVVSTGLIATMADVFGMDADPSIEIILTIVLYGVGTDYILFLLFRFRERLRAGDQTKPALVTSVHRVGEVIASAAGAIVIAFLALLLAVFGAFRSLGPALAIAVVVMGLAAVTLVPAIVSLFGTAVFWPSKSWKRTPKGTTFQRLGRFTGRRPAVVALVSGGLMVALAAGSLFMKTDYDQNAQLPGGTESAEGYEALQAGFPAGALAPTQVILQADGDAGIDPGSLAGVADRLRAVPGVGSIMPGPDGSPATLSDDASVARFDLLLAGSPYSNEALALAGGELRDVAHAAAPPGTRAYVGGLSSVFADIKDANDRDLRVIFPVAGLLIAVILALLLRSLVAPLYLIVAVVLGFFSTLGATVIVFQGIADRPGLSFSLPIILYLFVVAIGTDYNILMIARLREEARLGNDPRTAADLAVEHAGPSVGAAGLILAGTFASMLLAGVSFLMEMGFSVSVGILIAAFVMAMFLVPSVTALIGRRAWWPGHGDDARPTTADLDRAPDEAVLADRP
ncbi:putative membrane protein [Asanoa ishikariensis]|uniref:Putative drug exporter of the RND superfamily n=1 Tax=Asanoa ishikariensis TaxID=137265 RepID=A0A1H3TJ72_9ACTN|nr:MMPL family transporter [Asanoa ishikariensis]GIF62395.1 putative membrane protein [Asanoa ishikariensis]SDZ49851.1 putative drug exporter of the RND superfamily [Asanoa ishikariensis]